MSYPGFSFEIEARSQEGTRARLGRLSTPHGSIRTPNFIFCATKAAIKGVTMDQMRDAGTQIILSNTYHLMIQPGSQIVADQGGLHRWMGWDGPLLTDSGGFQIFSMGHGSVADEIKGRRGGTRESTLKRITEEGAEFRSYTSGEKIFLTPERSIDIQRQLAADLILQLDECTPFHVDRAYTKRSMEMSHRWGDRSLAQFRRGDLSAAGHPQALYGIIQGGVYPDLRRASSEYTAERDFFGTAVGGSLGASKEQMVEVVAMCMDHVHTDRPIHLLGIGGIADIFAAVDLGIDTLDCVSPTRIARHGWALMGGVANQRLNLRNSRFKNDKAPVDEHCPCAACRSYSRAYLHHLLKAEELLGPTLISIHNVAVMNRLVAEIREAIPAGRLAETKRRWLADGDPAA